MGTPLATTVAQGRAFMNLIDGQQVEAADGRRIDVICPSDGAVFASLSRSGKADIDQAVSAARNALEAGDWGRMAAFERGRVLQRFSQLVTENLDELAALESRDTGKPLRQGVADITAASRYFEFYAGAADKVHGATIPFIDGFHAMTVREPHGVIGAVIPWNYPSQIMGRIVGAGLAMGNAIVLKPAEDACLTPLRLAELAHEAGLPAGALNVVTGYGEEAGAALSGHPGIDYVTFTGSPDVGALIQKAAADNHIGCTLELGGKSPQILFADADLDAAIPVVVNAIIQNGGQTCSAGSRVLVHEAIWDDVIGALADRFKALVAAPHDRDADLGPLINPAQKDRVDGFTTRAEERGIPVLARGAIAQDAPTNGYYAAPVLYGPVGRDDALARDEVFGPVLSAIPFTDEADAVALANDTDYGLVAGVWTADGSRAMRVAKAVRSGQVYINAYGAGGGVELPFGGFRKSGHGREKGFEALYEFSAAKTIVINHG